MNRLISVAVVSALLALPAVGEASIFQFNTLLSGANEVPSNSLGGTGFGALAYNDNNTLTTTDDFYNFSLSVFGLSGAATGMHIHAPAAIGANGPIIIPLTTPNFLVLSSGNSVLIGGTNVAPPSSLFLGQLQSGLAYVNLHTALNPGGEIRGQLLPVVAAVPEPTTSAMFLAGIGLLGWMARRKAQAHR